MLSDAFLKRLDMLALRMKHPATGGAGGLRRSKALGSSVEFSDFREYAEGDDVRRVDWNAFARFDKLFLKLFMEEQEQRVNLIVDASASMAFGTPSKWDAAKQLVQALSYLSLCGGDRVMVYALQNEAVQHTRSLCGRQGYAEVTDFLEALVPEGMADLNQLLPRLPLPQGRGLCVLLSDMLSENGFERALQSLRYRKQEVSVLQLWSREEWEPTLEGESELVDSETGETFPVSASYGRLKRYRETAQAYVTALRDYCRAHAVSHAFLIPETPFEAQLLRELSRAGLIKDS
ncbi:MAG: DUF58 domain-containing protein [Clostridia bacterium]